MTFPLTEAERAQARALDPADAPHGDGTLRNFRCKRCEHRYINHGPNGCRHDGRCKCKAFCK